jgi:hypothetical protein
MKRILPLLAFPLVLAGCGTVNVSYELSYNTEDSAMQVELLRSSLRVIENRLQRMETSLKDQSVSGSGGKVILTLTLAESEAAEQLTAELTQPFKLRVMKEVPAGQGQITVEKLGDFAETGLTENDIIWAEAAEDSKGKGAVRLTFTPEGRTKLAAVFKENLNRSIGIFARDRLISKLQIKSDTIDENIVIRDIPNLDLARIFVDDLNVGLHVMFTPLP